MNKNCIGCGTELRLGENWSEANQTNRSYSCQPCNASKSTKTNPFSNKRRMYVDGKYIPQTHPLYKAGRYKSYEEAAFGSLQNYDKCKKGEVYIVKNPAWNDWYKIGKAVDAKDRCKGYQTGSPYRDYKLIYSFNTDDRNRAEMEAHKKAEKICLERRGEWFYTKEVNTLIEGVFL